jgi:hypothetical protein
MTQWKVGISIGLGSAGIATITDARGFDKVVQAARVDAYDRRTRHRPVLHERENTDSASRLKSLATSQQTFLSQDAESAEIGLRQTEPESAPHPPAELV